MAEQRKNEVRNVEPKKELENTQRNVTEEIKCPEFPVPVGFELPSMPPPDYYDKVPKEQLDLINGIKKKELNAASEKKEDDAATAENAHETARSAYAKAERERDSAKISLNTKSKNKKTELMRLYKEKLIGLLPKGCAVTGKDSPPIEERVPPEKLAVCIAELNKLLADEDIDYLKKYKEIDVKFADAENIWSKSKIDYDSARCEIKFTEVQAIKQAELVWRTSLSKLVEQYKDACK